MRNRLETLSATPSIKPTETALPPSTLVTKSGSTGWIISVDTSVRNETTPSATTLRVIPRRIEPLTPGRAARLARLLHFDGTQAFELRAHGRGIRHHHDARVAGAEIRLQRPADVGHRHRAHAIGKRLEIARAEAVELDVEDPLGQIARRLQIHRVLPGEVLDGAGQLLLGGTFLRQLAHLGERGVDQLPRRGDAGAAADVV